MSATVTQPVVITRRRLQRAIAVGLGIIAALALWGIAIAIGADPHTPAFSAGQPPPPLGPGLVILASAISGLAAWGSLALLERWSRRPRLAWTVLALAGLLVSLGGPLSAGEGVGGGNRALLAGFHLVVAAVVIPLLGRTARAGRAGE